MFYGQCNDCGQRWAIGTANTCTCEEDDEFARIEREAAMREGVTSAPAAQRTWIGLTDDEIEQGCKESWVTEQAFQSAVWWAEAKLRSKNT